MAKIIIENINVSNLPQAINSIRNLIEDREQSDSKVTYYDKECGDIIETELNRFDQTINTAILDFKLGERDRKFALKLIGRNSPHRKFMRQIGFIADITAPITWWQNLDAYEVSTIRNSANHMYEFGTRLLTRQDFAWDAMGEDTEIFRNMTLDHLNSRIKILKAAKKDPQVTPESLGKLWQSIIDDLPQSYMFKTTWSSNYEVLRDVYLWCNDYGQVGFDGFRTIIKSLPCSELITTPFEKSTQ